jgi:high-affinity Fe2+/Pb2+ permease
MFKSERCNKKRDELMQKKKKLLILNVFLLFCASSVFSKVDTLNLLDLLQKPTSNSVAKKPGTLLNLLQDPKSNSVSKKSAKTLSSKVEADESVSALLQNVEAVQNNPDYQAALTILSDKKMRLAYGNNMMSIQLFLLDYITQILQKYSVQRKKTQKSISLTDLLEKIVPETSVSGQHQLSNLSHLLQKESLTLTSGVTHHVNLEQFLQKEVATKVNSVQKKTSLEQLLMTSANKAPDSTVGVTKKESDLTNLLKAGQ